MKLPQKWINIFGVIHSTTIHNAKNSLSLVHLDIQSLQYCILVYTRTSTKLCLQMHFNGFERAKIDILLAHVFPISVFPVQQRVLLELLVEDHTGDIFVNCSLPYLLVLGDAKSSAKH